MRKRYPTTSSEAWDCRAYARSRIVEDRLFSRVSVAFVTAKYCNFVREPALGATRPFSSFELRDPFPFPCPCPRSDAGRRRRSDPQRGKGGRSSAVVSRTAERRWC